MGAPQFGLDNYIGAFNFKVTIDGIEVENSKFVSVSGVVSTSETMESMHGDDRFVMKQPGRAMFEDIELKRVYQQVDSFYAWREQIERGKIERKNCYCFFASSRYGNCNPYNVYPRRLPIKMGIASNGCIFF